MFGKKKWAAVILAVALAAGFTYPVRAEGEAETQVDNVALKIKSDIRPGSDQERWRSPPAMSAIMWRIPT